MVRSSYQTECLMEKSAFIRICCSLKTVTGSSVEHRARKLKIEFETLLVTKKSHAPGTCNVLGEICSMFPLKSTPLGRIRKSGEPATIIRIKIEETNCLVIPVWGLEKSYKVSLAKIHQSLKHKSTAAEPMIDD